MDEILISAQQGKIMADTQLRNQRIDRPDLNARTAAGVAKPRSGYVVIAVRLHQGQRRETIHDLRTRFGPAEPLEQLLQYKPCGDDNIIARQRVDER